MASSTSSIVHHISAFRNPEANADSYNCGRVALAELGYIVVIPYALVETAISHIVKAIAYCVQINQEKYEKISEWASSSAVALLWTTHCFAINFFIVHMSSTENDFSMSVLKTVLQPDSLGDPKPLNPNPGQPEPILNPYPPVNPNPNPEPDPVRPINRKPNPSPLDVRDPYQVPVRPNPPRRLTFEIANDDALDDEIFEQLLKMNALHDDKAQPQKPADTPADQGGKKPEVVGLVKLKPVKTTSAEEIPIPEPELPPVPVEPPKPVIKLDRIKAPVVAEPLDLTHVERNVQKIVNGYKVEPIKIVDDENPQNSKIIDVRQMLKNYELGDSAVSYTEYYDRICRELADFTNEDIVNLQIDLYTLCEGSIKKGYQFYIRDTLQAIADRNPRLPEDERFVKMLISVYKTVIASSDESEIEIMRGCIEDANQACRVRQNDEVQRLFIKFVAPRYGINISAEDCLVFEFMQHRIKLRENLLNILDCVDTHDRNFFSKELFNFFYLPKPSIVVNEWEPGDKQRKERRLKTAFRQCYDTTESIYTIFTGFLYPKPKEKFNYKPDMFIDWLKTNDLIDEAFADDMCTIYKPELIIRYLVETGFLKPKA